MGLKIRLARAGAKKRPYYHIVIADSRSPRDGRFIERVGSYNPMLPAEHADRVRLQPERLTHWLSQGAVATERVAKFLGHAGLAPMPVWGEQPVQSAPKKKAQERAKAAAAPPRPEADLPDSQILLGVIGRAHGVRGLVRVTSHTADPADLTSYGPLTDAKGRRFLLRWRGEGIAEVSELVNGDAVKVTDRTVAEGLTNTRLFVDRAQLPPVEDADEFYLSDLIGLPAFSPDGAKLGRVAIVHDYGAGVSLEIERPVGPVLIVPFTKACVPEVDIASGRVTIVLPEVLDADPASTTGEPDSMRADQPGEGAAA